jgi:hypothetical protein
MGTASFSDWGPASGAPNKNEGRYEGVRAVPGMGDYWINTGRLL